MAKARRTKDMNQLAKSIVDQVTGKYETAHKKAPKKGALKVKGNKS